MTSVPLMRPPTIFALIKAGRRRENQILSRSNSQRLRGLQPNSDIGRARMNAAAQFAAPRFVNHVFGLVACKLLSSKKKFTSTHPKAVPETRKPLKSSAIGRLRKRNTPKDTGLIIAHHPNVPQPPRAAAFPWVDPSGLDAPRQPTAPVRLWDELDRETERCRTTCGAAFLPG